MRQPCTKIGIRLGTLVTLRAEEQRDETTKLCLTGCRRDCASLWRKEHGSSLAGSSSCATRDPIHARK
jgi:hypothetical protein